MVRCLPLNVQDVINKLCCKQTLSGPLKKFPSWGTLIVYKVEAVRREWFHVLSITNTKVVYTVKPRFADSRYRNFRSQILL